MEKPGMGGGHRFYRTGLLTFVLLGLLFVLPSPDSSGQDAREGAGGIAVTLESSPERPVLGGIWRISILVDHPFPEEVTIIIPDLPPSLSFAQSRKEARFVGSSTERRRWTLAELLFVPHNTGGLVLGPFEALIGNSRILIPAARTTVIAREGEEYRPWLAWDALPPVLILGDAAELRLRILDRDPRMSLRRLPLRVDAPVDALLEEIPLTGEDLNQGLVLRLRLIPLEGSRISLGPFSLDFENLSLEAPAISLALAPQPRSALAATTTLPEEALPVAAEDGPPPEPPGFPSVRSEPFPLFRSSYRAALDKAREYWDRQLYAEALGELRRGERDLLSGPALASTRRAAEKLLGLPLTENEKWRPRNCFIALIIIGICLLPPFIVLARRNKSGEKGVTYPFFHGCTIVVFILIGFIGFGIVALAFSPGGLEGLLRGGAVEGSLGKRSGNAAAVLRSCAAYRVPDLHGAVNVRWQEGQPALVRFSSGGWVYAESSGGDAGWVTQDNIVLY